MKTLVARLGRSRRALRRTGRAPRERGQVLVIFVLATTALLGTAAIAADVSLLFVNVQRMQRAADAAALAGAVYLPGDPDRAFSTARAEAARNGYQDGTDSIDVLPSTDPGNPRRLIVDIGQPVGTYFARVFCIGDGACLSHVDLAVEGRAEYVLPVPMGSPQNYYGVGYFVDAETTTSPTTFDDDTGWRPESSYVSGGQWSSPGNAASNNNSYTTASSNGQQQVWQSFGLYSLIDDEPDLTIEGLQVGLTDVSITGSGTSTDCRVGVEVSWNAGSSWSTLVQTSSLSTSSTSDRIVGSSSSTSAWGSHTWARDDFSDANFRVRLTWTEGTATCSSSRNVRLDLLEVRVDFSYEGTTTSTDIDETDVVSPDGNVLVPQNFWGAMQTQGAPNIQGDAYMTYYDTRTSWTNDDYAPEQYYEYGVEFPEGSSAGEVWLFDPGFCNVDKEHGAGDYWNFTSSYGVTPHTPVSAFYDLYDTHDTPYQRADDTLLTSTGNTFKQLYLRDPDLDLDDPVTADDCRGEGWHNGWYRLADGLSGGKTYRLHSYTTDPDNMGDQQNTTALNSFAIWSKADGGTPRVYGLGAMEAYVRLPGGLASEFYLAQIEAEHAGKTMIISLWDPGDTGSLAANLQFLRPTNSTYEPVDFDWTAQPNSHHANTSDCDGAGDNGVSSVVTNTGSGPIFNGCWLTIEIPLPSDYSAPHPSSDTVTDEGGWWKIRYNMSGSTSSYSSDLTTWQVELRGSPVHLVIP